MAKTYSVNFGERLFLYDEYARRDAMTNVVLNHAKRYFKANEIKNACRDVTTPVNLLYVSAFNVKPLETVTADEKRMVSNTFKLTDKIVFRETYFDNVNFNVHLLESTKVRDIRQIQYIPAIKNERLTIGENSTNTTRKNHKQTLSIHDDIVKSIYVNRKELISLIDSCRSWFVRLLFVDELFMINDRKSRDSDITQHDEIYVADNVKKDIQTMHYDIFRIADMLTKNPDKHVNDKASITDYHKKNNGVYLNEHMGLLLTLSKDVTRHFKDYFGILSKYASSPNKWSKEQAVSITDDKRKTLGVVRKELIHLTEIYWDNVLFLVHITENIRTSDSVHRFIGAQLYEALRLISTLQNKTAMMIQEDNIAIGDSEINGLLPVMQEQVRIADNLRRTLHHTIKQLVKMADTLGNHTLKVSQETIIARDSYKKVLQVIKNVREYISAVDDVYRQMYKVNDERIYAADEILKSIEYRLKDSISTNESFNRGINYIRDFSDFIKAGDSLTREIGKNPIEDILIWDAYIHASNAYIEALRMVDEAQDEKWFQSMLESMPYYEEFTDFYVGDYEYEKACIRLVLQTETTDSKPTLYDVAANVDIDDTDDRGTANITDTTMPTKIYFNKHYYNAPEVQVTVNSGVGNETVTPYIVNTDGIDGSKRYFEVELRNDSNERVKGAISWISKGW